MFRALGARLSLDWKHTDDVAVAMAAAQATWQWATREFEDAPATWHEGEITSGELRVQAVHASDGARTLYRTTLHRPDLWDMSLVWRTTVDVVQAPDCVELGVAVEQDLRHHGIAPSPLQPPLLQLLQSLIARGAMAGSQPVTADAQAVVGTDSVAHFIERVLLDSERRLPVLLFTAVKEHDGEYTPPGTDPALVARELCGLAHVYLLPRAEDTHKLTKRLHLLSAYDGAIRIYWPSFRLNDPPPRHPLHLRTRLNVSSVPAIMRRIVEAGARAYRPPDGVNALLALRRREQQRARIAELVDAEPDADRRVEAVTAELMQAIDENVRLAQENETLRDELERSSRRLEDHEREISGVPQSTERQPDVALANPVTMSPSSSPRSS
ncbi:MAG: hypothetical protein ABR498_09680 [Candidatus Dormibacteria bacterium]